MNRLIIRLLLVVFTFNCLLFTPGVSWGQQLPRNNNSSPTQRWNNFQWGQQNVQQPSWTQVRPSNNTNTSKPSSINPLAKALAEKLGTQTPLTPQELQQRAAELRKPYEESFEYEDIVQSSYALYSLYVGQNYAARTLKEGLDWLKIDSQKGGRGIYANNSNFATKRNQALESIKAGNMEGEQILDFIDPFDPVKRNDLNAFYAAQYLTEVLAGTNAIYPGLEQFLRHAQLRILHSIQLTKDEPRMDPQRARLLGQLAITYSSIRLKFKSLYGKDPMENFNEHYAYVQNTSIPEVVIGGSRLVRRIDGSVVDVDHHEVIDDIEVVYENTAEEDYEQLSKDEWIRRRLIEKITALKKAISEDENTRYTAKKLADTLVARNKTQNFSFGSAAGDIAREFFLINLLVDVLGILDSLIGNMVGMDKITQLLSSPNIGPYPAPSVSLLTLASTTAEYDLIDHRLLNVRELIKLLDADKLAESNHAGTAPVYLNDNLYQGVQPAIAEVFNTIYVYAITPGRSAQEWSQIMDLLKELSDPHKYSIMVRLCALSVAAKLISLRQQARYSRDVLGGNRAQYTPSEMQPEMANYSLPYEDFDNMTSIYSMQARQNPTQSRMVREYEYFRQTGKMPYNYADLMLQYLIDLYWEMTAPGSAHGMQSYGLDATQMQEVAAQLVKLYNYIQPAAANQERYPVVLPPGQDHMEQVTVSQTTEDYNHIDVRTSTKTVLIHYGAKVTTSTGVTVYMSQTPPLNLNKKVEDGLNFMSEFMMDVLTWKLLISTVRTGIRAAKPLVKLVKDGKQVKLGIREAFRDGGKFSSEQAQLNARYVLQHPVPRVTSREEALKFLRLGPKATEAEIKQAFRELSKKYHPDMLPKTTVRGEKYVNEQFANLSNIRSFALGERNPNLVIKPGTPRAVTEADKTMPIPLVDEQEQARAAAKTAQRVASVEETMNIAGGFATFYAQDYVLGYPANAVEEEVGNRTAAQINQAYNNIPTASGERSEQPTGWLDDVAADAETVHQGGIFRLPLAAATLFGDDLFGRDYITIDTRANIDLFAQREAYDRAVQANDLVKFQKQMDKEIAAINKEKEQFLKNYKVFLQAIPNGEKELKTVYQTYVQGLNRVKNMAAQNLQKAQAQHEEEATKFINTQADLMVRCVKAYTAQQIPLNIAMDQQALRTQFPFTMTKQIEEQIKTIVTHFLRQREQGLIELFTASQRALQNESLSGEKLTQQASDKLQKAQQEYNKKIEDLQKSLAKKEGIVQAQKAQEFVEKAVAWKQAALDGVVAKMVKKAESLVTSWIQFDAYAVEQYNALLSQFQEEVNNAFLTTITQEEFNKAYAQAEARLDKGYLEFTNNLCKQGKGQIILLPQAVALYSQKADKFYMDNNQELSPMEKELFQAFNDDLTNAAYTATSKADFDKRVKEAEKLLDQGLQKAKEIAPNQTVQPIMYH